MAGVDLSTLNEAQRQIATTLDAPLFVEAGAGSGKTFTLTRRVVWALSPGSGVDGRPFLDSLEQVLVITFTNAAAREIRERVRSSLHEAGMHDAALSVDSAWISTIHGMCSRILRRSALDLGLDPNFAVASSHVEDTLIDQAVEQAVGAARRKVRRGTKGWQAFEEFEYTGVVSRVLGIVKAAHAAPRGFDDLYLPGKADVAGALHDLTMTFEAIAACKLTAAAEAKVTPALAALHAFEELSPFSRTAFAARDTLGAVSAPPASKAIKELAQEARGECAYAQALVALACAREYAPFLLQLARRTDAVYDELKRKQSLLDNDDLVTLALEAVRQDPVVAARYAGRFRLVMVDEFQDTDTKQLELISLLAGGNAHMEPRHLATVGDAQQSIYRFRGADVEVFNARGRRIAAEGHVRLDTNYRSHADVLSFVDAVCGGRQGVLNGFMHLDANPKREDAYRASALPRVSVEVASGPGHAGHASREQTQMLALQVADRLAAYREAGEPAGHMALLLGSTTKADLYIDALRDRGLECVVTGGSTFTKAPEVAVMLALLRALANPKDTQSGLFPVLSSEMFMLDANDFLQLGTRCQERLDAPTKRTIDVGLVSFDLFGEARPSERLRVAHRVMTDAWAAVGTKPVADICVDVVRASGWLARLEDEGASGIAREANVLAAVRYIRDLTDELGLGPARAAHEFSHWLDVSKVPPASLVGDDRDTVQVMTIHASKGLEYPVVAVAECWNNPRQGSGVLTGAVGDGRTAVVITPRETIKYDGLEVREQPDDLAEWAVSLRESNRAADAQEKARLLYVALTRAREALVVGLSAAYKKGGALSSNLATGVVGSLFGGELPAEGETTVAYGGSEPAYVRRMDTQGTYCRKTVPRRAANEEGEESGEERRAVRIYVDEEPAVVVSESVRTREDVFSYSSALAVREPSRPRREELLAEDEGDRRADEDKATDLGSAFHALAQAMVEAGLGADETLDAARVDAVAARWGLSARQRRRLGEALTYWTGCAVRREALGYGMLRAEVPFFSRVEGSSYGRYVEGAIDLLCTGNAACVGHALVVDYKTGDRGLTDEEIRMRHKAQANLYARVLLDQGFTNVTCAFVCVEVGKSVRYEF